MRAIRSGAVAAAFLAAAGARGGPVIVIVDMDTSRPGIQSSIDVPPGTTVVTVAIYIYDPEGTRSFQRIGYLGAIDRGISFGHMPGPSNHGHIASFQAHLGSPANPANTGFVFPAEQPGFVGPEVQYQELNAAAAAPFPTAPTAPVFTVDIHLDSASTGDVFDFYLLDMVTVWRGGAGGAFTSAPGQFLDCGGDAVPDRTQTLYGQDPDTAQPSPPAAFPVDYIDGDDLGPARITVGRGCHANCDSSTTPPVLNIADFACFLNRFASGDPYANCDHSTTPPVLNVNDFACFLNAFAAGCT